MSWCPKCKMEYQEGITICDDCQIELVESLEVEEEMVPLLQAVEKDILEKLIRYFDYSGLKASIQFDEANEIYEIFVPSKKQRQAKKLYQAFMIVESENQGQKTVNVDPTEESFEPEAALSDNDFEEDTLDQENQDTPEDDAFDYKSSDAPSVYVMKADRYKDLKDTVWIFLLFGVVGLLVVLLNVIGILSFINGIIPTLVSSALFLFFIYVGLSTHKKAKQVQVEIAAEKKLTDDINQWLEINVTEDYLSSLNDDTVSEEVNYIKKTEIIKSRLIKEFGEQNDAYLDRLIDEFYSSSIEGKIEG